MKNIRVYKTLKFKKTISYSSLEEEEAYFEKLHNIDPQLAIKKTDEIYEELLHVNWTYKFLFGILAILFALVSIFFMRNYPNIFYTIFSVSVLLILTCAYFNAKLQQIYKSYIIGKELYKQSLNEQE